MSFRTSDLCSDPRSSLRARVNALCVGLALVAGACVLNPQPIPPDDDGLGGTVNDRADADRGAPSASSGSSGMDNGTHSSSSGGEAASSSSGGTGIVDDGGDADLDGGVDPDGGDGGDADLDGGVEPDGGDEDGEE